MIKVTIMIKRFLPIVKLFSFALVISSLASCQATAPTLVFPELTFQHMKSLSLDVAKLETMSSYTPPMSAPNVDHLFHTSPAGVLGRWAEDRLRAVGKNGFARFTIIEASVTETPLDMKKGIIGAFTKDQSERYDAVLEAKLEIFDDSGLSIGFARAKATRSVTVREDSSVNQREQAWFRLTAELVRDIDAELEKNISMYLSRWLN
jgi:hypothetical protein